MAKAKSKTPRKHRGKPEAFPIDYWSHSSLVAYLRNPLAWYKRYVLKLYDTPRTPASVVGSAAHAALEHFYSGFSKPEALETGLSYLRNISDFELNFGVNKTRKAKQAKRASMEREYLQAAGFYLARAPRHRVVAVESRAVARVPGLPLPVKAISDLVVESKGNPGCLDIVDHKFVDSFSQAPSRKPLFLLQAMFNYYAVTAEHGRPVRRFIVYECKKTRNADGKGQLRRYAIEYDAIPDAFTTFHRLVGEATREIAERRTFLPNPSDMFEGEDSFALYHLGLLEDGRREWANAPDGWRVRERRQHTA